MNVDGTGAELYDVVADRGEMKNLAAEFPDRVKQMTEQALAWRAGLPKPE